MASPTRAQLAKCLKRLDHTVDSGAFEVELPPYFMRRSAPLIENDAFEEVQRAIERA